MSSTSIDLSNSGDSPVERPVGGGAVTSFWASDAIVALLRQLDLPYLCLTPGSSFRGLHDSVVNFLGNADPQMMVCLHEEHAVAMAHGYAKVTGKPLGVVIHANVGLMHASMAIYNAWCDRKPMIILGATGPVDAAKRRPWTDWVHTSKDQGALIRNFVKWDDQPSSVAAAQEALLRANLLTRTAPRAPVYICLDSELQESRLDALPSAADLARFRPPIPAEPAESALADAADLLLNAKNPVMLVGRVSRDLNDWQARIAFAEALGATVFSDHRAGAGFPTAHPQHGPHSGRGFSSAATETMRQADVVLSLDWIDLAGTLKTIWGKAPVSAKIVQVSVDQYIHNGWSMDHQGLPPVDLHLLADPDAAVPRLLAAIRKHQPAARRRGPGAAPSGATAAPKQSGVIEMTTLVTSLRAAVGERDSCLIRLPSGWPAQLWPYAHPLDFLGGDGGGGLGSGSGLAVGAALALRGSSRLPIAVLGDGDCLMGITALWTAAHYKIPLLVVVANNRSYYNDEEHQERMAKMRDRPVENRWIGQHLKNPVLDLAMIARGQGVNGYGPVTDPGELAATLERAIAEVRDGACCLVDVHIPGGRGH